MKKKLINYKTLTIIFTIIIMVLIILPWLQMKKPIFKEAKLHGVTVQQEKPEFKFSEWLNFEYQPKIYKYLLENYGFRSFYIKVYNQLRFSLFREYNKKTIVYGKQGQLYEPWFFDAYYGKNFLGDSVVEAKVKMIDAVIKELEKRNKKLFVVITPCKVTYYPEYIPNRMKSEKKRNNYEAFKEYFDKYKIPNIDYNSYFVSAKDTTKFPLFPKGGTHWSVYGGTMTLDSTTRFTEKLLQKPLTKINYKNITETTNITDQDIDLENLMNLMFPLKREPTGSIEIEYINDSNTFKPSVICISDSFYWILFGLPNKEQIYSDIKYWFYNREVFPDNFNTPTLAENLDLQQQIENTDVFMIMACPSTIKDIGWGFFERAYKELGLEQ